MPPRPVGPRFRALALSPPPCQGRVAPGKGVWGDLFVPLAVIFQMKTLGTPEEGRGLGDLATRLGGQSHC